MSIINEVLGLIVGMIIFIYLMDKIADGDPESGLHLYSFKESAIFGTCLLFSNLVSNYRFELLIDRIFFMVLLSIMILHSYTDLKTHTVYRPFNYFLWIFGFIYFIIRLWIGVPMMDQNPIMTTIYTIVFIVYIYIMTFKFKLSGKGDGFMLFGIALFIPFLACNTQFLSLEVTLIYYIISAIVQILTNLSSFNFKKFKFKERLPFAPALYISILVMMIFTKIFKNVVFFTYY